MSSFIKPLPNHWTPEDFSLSGAALSEAIRHITWTVCLLECRCDDYAEYLRAILIQRGEAWVAAVDQWNVEECQHGELLRRLSEEGSSGFAFDHFMNTYTGLVQYHAPDGQSVRGSIGAELVSRCVVEALASTLYRVLADASGDECCRRVYSALAQDEARHFGMFLRMLAAEAAASGKFGLMSRCRHAMLRMLALEDDQIMIASCVVARRNNGAISVKREANWYLAQLHGLYRWKHLRYAVRMLLQTVGLRPTRTRVALCTTAMWTAIKLRWGLAYVLSRRESRNANRAESKRPLQSAAVPNS